MNIQVRKCRVRSSYEATGVANLDTEKFKTLSIPFEGESEEDFLRYLSNNRYELQEEISSELDEETLNQLNQLWDPEWNEYFNSNWKGEESWLEAGKENSEYRKTGDFEITSTLEGSY